MKNRMGWVIAVLLVLFAAWMAYSTQSEQAARVEVCINFQGKQECRTATGATQAEAQRTATSTACAVLAQGMTASLQCENTTPVSVRVLD